MSKVAVITRTKNRPITLERAMKSVISQSENDWTHVIVNDGGDKQCVEHLVEQYSELYNGRVKVIHNPESIGMEAASNIGLKASNSKYVLIHDDDDSLSADFLKITINSLEENNLPSIKGVVTHTTQVFENVTENNIDFKYSQPFNSHLSSISLPKICQINQFMPISFLFEREVLESIGYYDESLPVCGDWEFNIRFLMKYDILIVAEELANYHIRVSQGGSYGNTVVQSLDKHGFYRSLIINKHLRKDLNNGNISLSHLLSLGEAAHELHANTWVVARVVTKLASLKLLSPIKRLFR